MNINADGLNTNPCPSQKDSIGARWHVGEDEKEMPRWYASMWLSLLAAIGDSSNGASTYIEGGEESGASFGLIEAEGLSIGCNSQRER